MVAWHAAAARVKVLNQVYEPVRRLESEERKGSCKVTRTRTLSVYEEKTSTTDAYNFESELVNINISEQRAR